MSLSNIPATGGAERVSPIKLLRFALKRTVLTAPYWTDAVKTFRYFWAARQNKLARQPVTWFRYKQLRVGVRPVDWYIMESIILQQEYALLQPLLAGRPPGIVVDAGANIGLFSVYTLAEWPDAEVYAIEASPETYAALRGTHAANPGHAWHIHQYALWDADGEVAFETEGLSIGWRVSEAAQVKVPAIRLDSFIQRCLPAGRRIALLKLDIEGAEAAVLQACPETLERVDAVLIEIHPQWCEAQAVIEVLRAAFPQVYDVATPNSHFPLVVASRWPVAAETFRPLA